MNNKDYYEFIRRFSLFAKQNKELITITLSNVFTMRLIGNKTHGDLAEIAISEFINQYMYDFKSIHVGKDLYRAKSKEEDITITNLVSNAEFPVSLKAYGDGPLQLSTDKNFGMYPLLEKNLPKGKSIIDDKTILSNILSSPEFSYFRDINVLPLIYNEKKQQCNILVFDVNKAISNTLISRQYGANYHLLNTIALYDNFIPKGKTGLRDYQRSKYCSKSTVVATFEDLIKNAEFDYIFLSYNNEGLMSNAQVRAVLERYGKYHRVEKEYQRFKADKTENRHHKANSTFLIKSANDAKRQICKRCKETNKRWDAKNLLGNPYSFYQGDENYTEDLGCIGCYQYDPVEYRKNTVRRVSEEASKHTSDFIFNKLYPDTTL